MRFRIKILLYIACMLGYMSNVNARYYVGMSHNFLDLDYQDQPISDSVLDKEKNLYHSNRLENQGLYIGTELSESLKIEFNYFRDERYKYTTGLKTGIGLGFVSADIIYSKPITFSDQLELGYLVGVSHVKAKVGEAYSSGGNVTAYHVHTNKSPAINLGIKASYNVNPNYGYNLYFKYINLHDLAFPGLKNVNRIHSMNMLTMSVFFNF